MSYTVFFIDYKHERSNGLQTYTNELIDASEIFHERGPLIPKFVFVWFDDKKISQPRMEMKKYHLHIYLPYNKNVGEKYDLCVKTILDIAANLSQSIIHLNWLNHMDLAWRIKQKCDCKIILTKHCIPWRELITLDYRKFYRLNSILMSQNETCPPSFLDQAQKFEREGYANIDEIISVTDFAKDSLVRIFGIMPEKITRIYNGISMPILQNNVKELRKSFGISTHEKIILFAGKIAENKGITTLLDAFEMLIEQGFKNTRLIFAGKGNFDLLFRRSQKLAMQISILGDVSKETLSDLYQIADVGVVPSYIEQCSFTAIEMMAHGLPLIVANIDGLKEIVPEKYKYKFDIDMTPNIVIPNIISLYLFLKELISTDNQILSQNLIQHVQKRFTNINMFESTLRLYEKTLSSAILLSNNPNKLESPKNTTKSSDFSPLVSVILPVYNGEAYIAECIDSILSQTFSEFELIIINDGSLDKTDEIVNSIKDHRIRYFKFKTNKGITNALNKGLRESKTNYIGRIDADDLMHKDRLKTQFAYLSENPKVGVVASWYKVINAEGMNIGSVDHDLTSSEIKFMLMFKNLIGHPTTMFRKDCLGKLFYRNKYKKCEDYDLWERIISNQKDIVILKEYLTKYRIHSNNNSSTLSNEVEDSIAKIVSRQLFKYFPSVNDKQMVLHLAKSLNKTTGHNQEKQFNDYINQLISLSNDGINRDKLIGILN